MSFIPNRYLQTTEEERELLATDELAYKVFIDEEQEKVANSFTYFLVRELKNPLTALWSNVSGKHANTNKTYECNMQSICQK